jgi:hypothetical protein
MSGIEAMRQVQFSNLSLPMDSSIAPNRETPLHHAHVGLGVAMRLIADARSLIRLAAASGRPVRPGALASA